MTAARPAGRRRAQVSGRYFALSWERPAAPPAQAQPAKRPMIAVAKKLVPSSPLRNAIRRVVREAARARPQPALPGLLVRLVALPTADEAARPATAAAASSAGAASSAAPSPAVATGRKAARPARPFDRRLTDRALKRACRADLDALLGQAGERYVRDAARAASQPAG